MLAKLKGHKNHDAPALCYVFQSNCLVTGEKNSFGNSFSSNLDEISKPSDPNANPSHKVNSKQINAYTQYANRHLNSDRQF